MGIIYWQDSENEYWELKQYLTEDNDREYKIMCCLSSIYINVFNALDSRNIIEKIDFLKLNNVL